MGAVPGPARPPREVLAAAALVALEGVLTVAYALYLGVRALVDDPTESVVGVELGALLVLALGAVLLAAARGVGRLRAWARAPVATVQLLLLLTAVSFLPVGGLGYLVGAGGAGLLAVGVLLLLFSTASRDAFEAADGREPQA